VFEERCDLEIEKLRRATAADHRAVEDTVSLMHEGLMSTEYVLCLQRIYGIVAAWEDHAANNAPEWMQPTVVARQRKSLLELDLAWFGVLEKDDMRPTLPKTDDTPSFLGSMYVMEGSTLGGQLIARHVETALYLSEGQGDAYFRGHGDQTGPMWKEFCEVLKIRVPDQETDAVVNSAKAMFATFGEWMRGNRS
jgi:heme oxygenase